MSAILAEERQEADLRKAEMEANKVGGGPGGAGRARRVKYKQRDGKRRKCASTVERGLHTLEPSAFTN